jgi:eukaryotic-like serine/threonine-protein kinase
MAADARPQGGQLASGEHDQLTRLGKYAIERRLGAGGMGTVFLAVDSELKRTVALKVLPKDRAENPVLVKRFKAEGQAAAYLRHKNIVGVYEAGQIDGFLYIALEYIDGTDVLDIIRKRGVIPVKRSLEIILQVTEAIEHAFEKQIVHRDIKPSNLLISRDGTVKLADLGLARSIDDTLDTSITRAGTTVGTVDYMSPEQARNSKAADIRSDIYSLGCTWYHMLTGVPPFGEGSMTNKLQAHAISAPPDPRARNEKVPEGVVAVLQRMMAKRPQDRYQTPAELLEDLKNPGMTRGGLHADVLAALADEGDEVAEDGSTSSVEVDSAAFEMPPQSPADTRGKSDKGRSTTEPDTRDSIVTSAENPSKTKPGKKSSQLPPRSPGPQVERQTPQESDDSWKSAPYKRKDRPQPVEDVRAKLPPRSSVTMGETEGRSADPKPRAAEGKSRKPPRRGDEAILSGTAKTKIDPLVLKFGLVGVLVVAILGGLWYAFASSSDPTLTGGAGGANPYQGSTQAPGTQTPEQPPEEAIGKKPSDDNTVKVADNTSQAQPTVDAATQARKAAASVAGAEDLDLSGDSGRQFVPDWVIAARKPQPRLPAAVVVARGARGGQAVLSFADALAKLPPGEAVIEFSGDGPFAISKVELPNRSQLTLRASEDARPVLVLATDDVKTGEAVLRFGGGRLVLEGVHLVLATRSDTAEGIAMVAAPVSVIRNCTFTQGGPSNKTMTAIDVVDAAGAIDAGCVLENCVVRGNSLSAVRLTGKRSNVLAGNSLVAAGSAPCFDVVPVASKAAATTPRRISLLGVSAISASGVFRLRHGLPDPVTPCEIACRRTLFLAEPNGESTWLTAAPWPAAPANDLESPLAAGVKWTSDKTAFAGWKRLVHFESGSGANQDAVDDAGWKQFWRQSATSIESRPEPVVLAEEDRRLDPAVVATAVQAAGIPNWGCDASKLVKAPQGLLDRALAFAERRRIPADFIADREPSQVVTFDLEKGPTLQTFLNDPSKCPDGSVVELRGSGRKSIPPIKIQNKSLRLKFVQGDDAPLVIRPHVTGGAAAEAWIAVEGGSVDLVGARLILPVSDRQPYPPSILKVTNGSFSIRQCTVVGPADRSQKAAPLIVWSPGGQGSGLIEDSLLMGRTAIVEADLANRLLEVRNSVLASFDDVFRLTSGADATGLGTLAVQDTTIATGVVAYRINAAQDQAAHLAVFLSHSVYIPTFSGPGQTPTVLSTSSQHAARGIHWWEDGIGYGPQLQQILVQDSVPAVKPSEMPAAWESLWKDGHVLRPLADPLGVALDKPLGDPEKMEPAGFALSPNCAAASWNATGGPIGARIADVGVSDEPAPAQPEATTNRAKPAKSQPPRIKPPDF